MKAIDEFCTISPEKIIEDYKSCFLDGVVARQGFLNDDGLRVVESFAEILNSGQEIQIAQSNYNQYGPLTLFDDLISLQYMALDELGLCVPAYNSSITIAKMSI